MTAVPCSSDDAPRNAGITHDATCWRWHHACANARLERFEAVLRGVKCDGYVASDGEMDLTVTGTVEHVTAFRALVKEVRDVA